MWHDANNNDVVDEGEIKVVLRDGLANENNQLVIKSSEFSYYVVSSRDANIVPVDKAYKLLNTGIGGAIDPTVNQLTTRIRFVLLGCATVAVAYMKKKSKSNDDGNDIE